ncbi:MAG: DUF445 family protein [Actinobacteria bacterium]|jgi:uncharacterized membrane-anchored protein YjiN (DUF445 family)|uniref:Unannotated protein n=1 Tax=freshwater metagenome TaxID=449393 RepID=A0A6J6C4B2_9ZZZZ|nr:DUF445 family protein [Actinomycetota bacterium]
MASDSDLLDRERAAELRRMKWVATGLLVAVAALFVLMRSFDDRSGWVGYVEAFAEAAMVGALADWFAVTALFRHPLGLPIPHTAIIPKRKDQIGQSLGTFVQDNFLTEELLNERLAKAHVGARLGEWLSHPANALRASSAAGDVIRGALEVVDDAAISGSIEAMVERRIRATPVAPLVGRAIDVAVENGHHQRLLDATMSGLKNFLDDNRVTFRERLQHESPWWVPESIDDRIFDKIFTGVHRFLDDVGTDHDHEVRRSIDQRVIAFAQRLRDDPELVRKGEELKEELLEHPDVRAWIASLWGEVKHSLEQAAVDPDSELRRRMTFSLSQLGHRLRDDAELQGKVDRWVASAGGYLVANYRHEVANMISSTVERWDAESTGRRLELQVGRDLQFIRINGTVVGGLAGLLIHLLTDLL